MQRLTIIESVKTLSNVQKVGKNMKKIIENALKNGGSTLKDIKKAF